MEYLFKILLNFFKKYDWLKEYFQNQFVCWGISFLILENLEEILYPVKEFRSLLWGSDLNRYVIYEDHDSLERKFKELVPLILKLEPKNVKKFGISRQTLWNIKRNIILNQFHQISTKIKITLIKNIVIY